MSDPKSTETADIADIDRQSLPAAAGDEPNEGRGLRRARIGFLALSVLALAGAVIFVLPNALAGPGDEDGRHGWFHGHRHRGEVTVEKIREHLGHVSGRVADRLDASEAQQKAIDALLQPLAPQILGFRTEGDKLKERAFTALGREQLNRDELEQIRKDALDLANRASMVAVDTLVDVSETLTPEQRSELMEDLARLRKWHRR